MTPDPKQQLQPQCPVCNAFIARGSLQCRKCLTEFDVPKATTIPLDRTEYSVVEVAGEFCVIRAVTEVVCTFDNRDHAQEYLDEKAVPEHGLKHKPWHEDEHSTWLEPTPPVDCDCAAHRAGHMACIGCDVDECQACRLEAREGTLMDYDCDVCGLIQHECAHLRSFREALEGSEGRLSVRIGEWTCDWCGGRVQCDADRPEVERKAGRDRPCDACRPRPDRATVLENRKTANDPGLSTNTDPNRVEVCDHTQMSTSVGNKTPIEHEGEQSSQEARKGDHHPR